MWMVRQGGISLAKLKGVRVWIGSILETGAVPENSIDLKKGFVNDMVVLLQQICISCVRALLFWLNSKSFRAFLATQERVSIDIYL